jgi:uncharacterized protein (DUF697 family)
MSADEGERRGGLPGFGKLTAWVAPKLGRLLGGEGLKSYQDTLQRLLSGDFKSLEPAERERRANDIIQASANATVGMAALPVPFLDLPVLVTMVGAIGKVYGLDIKDRQLYAQVLATLGGGLMLRQLLRAIPFGGTLYASQVYGATWALGRVAQRYSATRMVSAPDELHRLFDETLARKAAEHQAEQTSAPGPQSRHSAPKDTERRLMELQGLRERGLITDEEFAVKRGQILAGL